MSEIEHSQLLRFMNEKGRRGAATLSTLGKLQPFMQAIKTECGQELLRDLNTRYDELLNKIAELAATEEDKADFRAVRALILRWCEKINNYEK